MMLTEGNELCELLSSVNDKLAKSNKISKYFLVNYMHYSILFTINY